MTICSSIDTSTIDEPQLLRQRVDRAPQSRRPFCRDRLILETDAAGRRPHRSSRTTGAYRPAGDRAPAATSCAPARRGTVAIPQLREPPIGAGERLLRHVLGILLVPDDAVGHAERQRGRVGQPRLELPVDRRRQRSPTGRPAGRHVIHPTHLAPPQDAAGRGGSQLVNRQWHGASAMARDMPEWPIGIGKSRNVVPIADSPMPHCRSFDLTAARRGKRWNTPGSCPGTTESSRQRRPSVPGRRDWTGRPASARSRGALRGSRRGRRCPRRGHDGAGARRDADVLGRERVLAAGVDADARQRSPDRRRR